MPGFPLPAPTRISGVSRQANPIWSFSTAVILPTPGVSVLETDARSGKGVNTFVPAVRQLLSDKLRAYEEKGQVGRPLRIMILGIPNVGKSTLINKIAGRKAAIASDRPGVTRGKQWISLSTGLDLLDTPGILWPKFESQEVGELLAVTNAIKTEVFDIVTLSANFMLRLRDPSPTLSGFDLLEQAALKRGFLISRGEADLTRMATTLLKEYHEGKLGRLTLERPAENG